MRFIFQHKAITPKEYGKALSPLRYDSLAFILYRAIFNVYGKQSEKNSMFVTQRDILQYTLFGILSNVIFEKIENRKDKYMKLTQIQFKEILSNMLTEPNGVTRLMVLILDIAMECERNLYKEDVGNVSNGYRPLAFMLVGYSLSKTKTKSLYKECPEHNTPLSDIRFNPIKQKSLYANVFNL